MPGAEVGGPAAAAPGVHAHGQQGQADGNNHAGGHHRREEALPVPGAQAHQALKNAAQDDRANHPLIAQIRIGANDQEASKEGEADAHYDGQLGADFPDGVELHAGADTGGKHGALEQAGDLHCGEVIFRPPHQGGAAHNEHRGKVGHKHGQNMLQAEGDGLGQGDAPIEPVDVFRSDGLHIRFLVFHFCTSHRLIAKLYFSLQITIF